MQHVRFAALALAILCGLAASASAQSAPAQPMATPAPEAPKLIAPKQTAFTSSTRDAAPSSVTQAKWLAAGGTWSSATEDGILLTKAVFTGLVPSGRYSLFTRHVKAGSELIEPVDHSGTTNSFVASPAGGATLTLTLSQPIVSGDRILLVYHTDLADHAKTIGRLGSDAFIQLQAVQP